MSFGAPNKKGAGGGANGIAGKTREAFRAPGGGAGGEPAWTEEACKAPEKGTGESAGGGASKTGKAFRAPTMRGAGQGESGAGGSFTAPSKDVGEKVIEAGEGFPIACALSNLKNRRAGCLAWTRKVQKQFVGIFGFPCQAITVSFAENSNQS